MGKVTKPKTDVVPKTTGGRLEYIRKNALVSQEELAKLLNIKREYLSMIERGERSLKIDMLKMISQRFNVSSDFLLCLSDVESPDVTMQEIYERLGLDEEVQKNLYAIRSLEDHRAFIGYSYTKSDMLNAILKNKDLLIDLLDALQEFHLNYLKQQEKSAHLSDLYGFSLTEDEIADEDDEDEIQAKMDNKYADDIEMLTNELLYINSKGLTVATYGVIADSQLHRISLLFTDIAKTIAESLKIEKEGDTNGSN